MFNKSTLTITTSALVLMSTGVAQGKDIGAFLEACSMVIMEHCGGASGPVWGFAFKTAGKVAEGKQELTVAEFAFGAVLFYF